MSIITKFLKLVKPERNDYVDVDEHISKNYDRIDTWATQMDEDVVKKEKIANNLTTAEEGYVLDGRQGKILDDKKFDKAGGTITGDVQINNSSFKVYESGQKGVEIHGNTPFLDFYNSNTPLAYTTRIVDNKNGLEYWKDGTKVFGFDSVVTDIRFSGLTHVYTYNIAIDTYQAGRVIVGVGKDTFDYNIDYVRYATLQKKVGDTWYTIAVE